MRDDTHQLLGRYGPPAGSDEPPVTVRLLNFPLQVFDQARQHHDELLREFSLLAMRPPEGRPDRPLPAGLLELVDLLGRQLAAPADRIDMARDSAVERGELTADLTYRLPRSAAAPLRRLHELMEQANRFCADEALLTLAETPVERGFRDWFTDQVLTQLDGADPVPYDGPLQDAAHQKGSLPRQRG